jgi:hypothetical protein
MLQFSSVLGNYYGRSVVDKVAQEQVFSQYFCFPCQSLHRLLHTHHYPSSGAGITRQIVDNVPSVLSLAPPQETNVNNW